MNGNNLTYEQVGDLVLELKAEYERWLWIWKDMGVSDTFTEGLCKDCANKKGDV